MCTQESVLQSQLRDALHQLSVAHSQTSKDAGLVMRLQRQVEDQRQQVQELTNQSSEQQGALQQLRELADKREAELLQCQVTSEQLREEERRRAVVELELEGAREQLRVAQGRLADEQAHLQGVQLEVCAWARPCDCTSLSTVPPSPSTAGGGTAGRAGLCARGGSPAQECQEPSGAAAVRAAAI